MHKHIAPFVLETPHESDEPSNELVPMTGVPIVLTHCQHIASPAQRSHFRVAANQTFQNVV